MLITVLPLCKLHVLAASYTPICHPTSVTSVTFAHGLFLPVGGLFLSASLAQILYLRMHKWLITNTQAQVILQIQVCYESNTIEVSTVKYVYIYSSNDFK